VIWGVANQPPQDLFQPAMESKSKVLLSDTSIEKIFGFPWTFLIFNYIKQRKQRLYFILQNIFWFDAFLQGIIWLSIKLNKLIKFKSAIGFPLIIKDKCRIT
jgi:hypothetical protein